MDGPGVLWGGLGEVLESEARSEKREARSEKREKREARSEKKKKEEEEEKKNRGLRDFIF